MRSPRQAFFFFSPSPAAKRHATRISLARVLDFFDRRAGRSKVPKRRKSFQVCSIVVSYEEDFCSFASPTGARLTRWGLVESELVAPSSGSYLVAAEKVGGA